MLGIDNLWIDSLCIIQDSASDWQQQSAQMAQIYMNSYMTLSATTAKDDSAGCFRYNQIATHPIRDSPWSQNPSIHVREKLRHWTDHAAATFKDRFPLLTRGWVFQERVLSARTLHFCDQELVWECAETTTCECGSASPNPSIEKQFAIAQEYAAVEYFSTQARTDDSDDDEEPGSQARYTLRFHEIESATENLALSAKARLQRTIRQRVRGHAKRGQRISPLKTNQRDPGVWHKMVAQYSNLNLSRMSDRLPALSGLAEQISPESRPYLAGLWQDTLRLDLLWRIDCITESHKRIPGSQSPSWSWASVSSGVKYWTREELKENIFYTRLDLMDFQSYSHVGRTSVEKYRSMEFPLRPGYNGLGQRWVANRAWLDELLPEMLDCCLLERASTSVPFFSLDREEVGLNPYGEAISGALMVRGFMRRARLEYVKLGTSDKRLVGGQYNPFKYKLDFSTGLPKWAAPFHGIQDQYCIEFYADYNLSNPQTEHQVQNGADVHLLEVLVNLYLVLRQVWHGDFQRIGIFRAPMALDRSYGVDLMRGGEMTTARLI